MTDISSLNTKDVLTESSLTEYERGMEFFFIELVDLNTILYLAEEISKFPFELFAHPDKSIFFTVVMRSFYDSAVLILTKLATDQAGDFYTLPRFKNKALEWVRPEYKESFATRLRDVRFDREVRSLFEKAKELRVNRIAHTTQGFVTGSLKPSRPSFAELKTLRDALTSLLKALSINVGYIMLPIPYHPDVIHPVGSNHTTDIEELLDSIAKSSKLLNLPEKNPQRWHHRRRSLSGEQINQLNCYRRKFGLPEI